MCVFQRREEHAKVKGNEIVNGKVFQRRFFTVLEHLLLKMIFWKSYFNTCFKDDFYKTVLQKLNLISKMAPLIFLRRFFKNWLRFNMLKHVFICFWFESRLVSCWLEVKLEMKANFGRKFHRRCTRMLISFSKWLEKHILCFQIQPKVIHMIFLLVNESEFIIKYSLRIRAGWARER